LQGSVVQGPGAVQDGRGKTPDRLSGSKSAGSWLWRAEVDCA
jgi:hypothetical protein